MNVLRKTLPPLPNRMKSLPIDERGYPVPWFVTWIDGKPDFRLLDEEKFILAVRLKACSVCGTSLGRFKSFVGGPMNVLQMLSGEPPMHHECAFFAVRACPFLLLPLSKRRKTNLPGDIDIIGDPGDVFFEDNPGITSIWTCTRYHMSEGGRIFRFDDAHKLEWFSEGEPATTERITAALHSARDRLNKIQESQHATR